MWGIFTSPIPIYFGLFTKTNQCIVHTILYTLSSKHFYRKFFITHCAIFAKKLCDSTQCTTCVLGKKKGPVSWFLGAWNLWSINDFRRKTRTTVRSKCVWFGWEISEVPHTALNCLPGGYYQDLPSTVQGFHRQHSPLPPKYVLA